MSLMVFFLVRMVAKIIHQNKPYLTGILLSVFSPCFLLCCLLVLEEYYISRSTSLYRFMGMKAAILTNNSSLKSFSAKLGFSVLQLDEFVKDHSSELQENVAALELLKLLGFQEGKVLDNNYFDLVFFHIGAGEKVDSYDQKVIAADIEYVNTLVGGIMSQAQPGSEIGSRLHLSVVMSYGNVLDGDDSKYSVSKRVDEKNSYLSGLFPMQSYTMKGGSPQKDVR